jgi:hypothetical protein
MKTKKKNFPRKLEKYNFEYIASIEYDTISHCEENGCQEEGMCRCSTIENTRIEKEIDTAALAVSILPPKSSLINEYCVERILRINHVYDPELYEVCVTGGYYGEEIGEVILDWRVARTCDKQIVDMLALKTDDEKILYVLKLEYGYVLEGLEKLHFTIRKVDKKDIFFPQEGYAKRLDPDMLERYEKWELPRGICVEDNGKYKVVDGYHRCTAGKGKIEIIVGVKK